MYSVQEIGEEQERQYNQLMQEDDQYCHPESFKWGFEHGFEYALSKHGWHPAIEPPKEGDEVIVITLSGATAKAIYSKGIYYSVVLDNKAYYPSVEYWCYPPRKEDNK